MSGLTIACFTVGLKEFNSSKVPTTPIAIFNGQRFVLHLGFSNITNKLKLLWHYGMSLFSMSRTVGSQLKKFSTIYQLQAEGKSFRTVPDMLKAMGGNTFYNETQVSCFKWVEVITLPYWRNFILLLVIIDSVALKMKWPHVNFVHGEMSRLYSDILCDSYWPISQPDSHAIS